MQVLAISGVFQRFTNAEGEFKQSLSNNLEDLMSLHEASFLNMGEEILYKANEFSTKHLKSFLKDLAPDAGALVRHTLDHPYHTSLKMYKAKLYLELPPSQRNNVSTSMEELAQIEFQAKQQLYRDEFKKITRYIYIYSIYFLWFSHKF
jgi:Terpene synthase, N-terminal domain